MGRPTKPSNLKRIQMDMSPQVLDRLKRLQECTEAVSYAEVVKTALKIYEHVLSEQQQGGEVIFRKDNKERALVTLM